MIELYTAATPNGIKISIALEELELDYKVTPISLSDKTQKQDWFLKICPNGRIPAIIDHDNDDFAVFESGAILVYLANKTGRLMPQDDKGQSLVMQWLMFQMGGIGPMMGQANVFYRYTPEKIEYAINRYQHEVRRLFGVLDMRLADHQFLAGDYSIADIANWCWVFTYKWSGVEVDGLEHLQRWLAVIETRSAVQRGIIVPDDSLVKAAKELQDEADQQKFIEGARNMLA